MITRLVGQNIFNAAKDGFTVVVPVNAVGVTGAGMAYSASIEFVRECAEYRKECWRKAVAPGCFLCWREMGEVQPRCAFFTTKDKWNEPSSLEWIEEGLDDFISQIPDHQLKKVAFPKLGCGCGKLSWEEVWPIMEAKLSGLDMEVRIYE